MTDKLSREEFKFNVDVSKALTGLKALQRETRKAIQGLKELESVNDVYIKSDYQRFKQEIVNLVNGEFIERFKITNDTIFSAYHNGEKEINLYFGRLVGVSTSIKALQNIYDDIVYISHIKRNRHTPNLNNKVVFMETGFDLPRGMSPKKVIRIIQIDNCNKSIITFPSIGESVVVKPLTVSSVSDAPDHVKKYEHSKGWSGNGKTSAWFFKEDGSLKAPIKIADSGELILSKENVKKFGEIANKMKNDTLDLNLKDVAKNGKFERKIKE